MCNIAGKTAFIFCKKEIKYMAKKQKLAWVFSILFLFLFLSFLYINLFTPHILVRSFFFNFNYASKRMWETRGTHLLKQKCNLVFCSLCVFLEYLSTSLLFNSHSF